MPRDAARVWTRALIALFVAYVAATAVHVGWVVAHEPFSYDAWLVALDTHARPFSLGRLLAYWRFEYTHANPRLGQPLAYLAYKLADFAVIATPLAYLMISLAITVLGLGRWPWRRSRDLALWAVAIGAMWFALPELPKWMFSRAYGTNYVDTLAIQLWFLVPLRLARGGRTPTWAVAAYAAFGVAAGMCNEHTGPTLIAFLVGYGWTRRRTDAPVRLAWAGAAGAALGFAAIMFAPGQGERYDGLAHRASLFGTVLARGVPGNLAILDGLLVAAGPALALIAIALVVGRADTGDADAHAERRGAALRVLALAIAASVAMAATLFASPKLGSRFYLGSCSLLLVAFLALADAVLVTRRRLAAFVAVAVFASGYAAARTVGMYRELARASDARLAALEAAPPGEVFVADGFAQVDSSWWFLGDDLRFSLWRERVAGYFGLPGIVYRGYDPRSPLGVTSVHLVAHVAMDPPGCVDDHGGFALPPIEGSDLTRIRREVKLEIELLRERIGTAGQLLGVDVAVELADPQPALLHALPSPHLWVARWRSGHLEAYVGRIVRRGVSRTHEVVLPRELAGADRDIYIYRVGGRVRRLGTARDGGLSYQPWRPGVYWALACDGDGCFVIAVTHQG